jgi:hypothetical protein
VVDGFIGVVCRGVVAMGELRSVLIEARTDQRRLYIIVFGV